MEGIPEEKPNYETQWSTFVQSQPAEQAEREIELGSPKAHQVVEC